MNGMNTRGYRSGQNDSDEAQQCVMLPKASVCVKLTLGTKRYRLMKSKRAKKFAFERNNNRELSFKYK